jgi:hypothetical protein
LASIHEDIHQELGDVECLQSHVAGEVQKIKVRGLRAALDDAVEDEKAKRRARTDERRRKRHAAKSVLIREKEAALEELEVEDKEEEQEEEQEAKQEAKLQEALLELAGPVSNRTQRREAAVRKERSKLEEQRGKRRAAKAAVLKAASPREQEAIEAELQAEDQKDEELAGEGVDERHRMQLLDRREKRHAAKAAVLMRASAEEQQAIEAELHAEDEKDERDARMQTRRAQLDERRRKRHAKAAVLSSSNPEESEAIGAEVKAEDKQDEELAVLSLSAIGAQLLQIEDNEVKRRARAKERHEKHEAAKAVMHQEMEAVVAELVAADVKDEEQVLEEEAVLETEAEKKKNMGPGDMEAELRKIQTQGLNAEIAELRGENEQLGEENEKLLAEKLQFDLQRRLAEDEDKKAKIAQFGKGLLQKWKSGTVARVFAALHQHAQDSKAERALQGTGVLMVSQLLAQWALKGLGQSLRQWVEVLQTENHQVEMMQQFAARWTGGVCRQAFLQWLHICKINGKCTKIIRRMMNAHTHAALHRWCEALRFEENEQEKSALVKKYEAMLQAECDAHAKTKLDLGTGMEAREQQYRQQMIEQTATQVLRRWKNATLCRVFDGLHRNAELEKRDRYLVVKFATMMKLRGAKACLNTWVELRDQRQLCRRVMKKMVGRIQKQEILSGWSRWREWWYRWKGWMQSLQAAREAQVQAESAAKMEKDRMQSMAQKTFESAIQEQERKLQVSLVRRFVKRWSAERMREAFSIWTHVSKTAKLIWRVLRRLSSAQVEIAVEQWRDVLHWEAKVREATRITELHDAAVQAEHDAKVKLVTQMIVNRWKNGTLTRVYGAWCQYTRDRQHDRALFEKTFRRMTHVKLATGFYRWGYVVEEENRLRKAMNLVFHRLSNFKTAAAFGHWEDICAQVRHEAAMAKMLGDCRQECMEEAEAKQTEMIVQLKCKNILARWKNGLLVRVYEGWVEYAETNRRNRYLVQKFVSTMKQRGVRGCLNRWVELREERMLCRRIMQKVLGCYAKRGMLAGWASWKDWAAQQKVAALEHSTKIKLFTRFLRWSGWRDIGTAWSFWKEVVRFDREALLHNAGERQAVVLAELRLRLKQERIALVEERTKVLLLTAWKNWSSEIRTIKHARTMSSEAEKRNAGAAASAEQLQAMESELQHQREVMIEQRACQVLRRWKNALLYRVYEGWVEFTETEKRNKYLVQKVDDVHSLARVALPYASLTLPLLLTALLYPLCSSLCDLLCSSSSSQQ